MNDLQQRKDQIDEEARKAKQLLTDQQNTFDANQLAADQKIKTVMQEAEKATLQIQKDAQK